MLAVSHARQPRHRLTLTACGHDQNFFIRILVKRVRLDQSLLRNAQFANLHSNAADVHHASADEADTATVAHCVVNDHLHTVNVRREHGNNDSALRFTEHIFKRHADFLFGDGITGTFDVCGLAQHRQHAAFAQLSEGRKIGDVAVYRRVVNLEVTRHDDRACRAGQRNGTCTGNGVADVDEPRREVPAELHLVTRLNDLHRDALNAVLLQFQVNQRQRQLRAVQRCRHLTKDVRCRADMILMTVGEEITSQVPLLLHQIRNIRDDQINAEHVLLGKDTAAVNHNNIILIFKDRHILADLIDTAKADDPQTACRLCCFRLWAHSITLLSLHNK